MSPQPTPKRRATAAPQTYSLKEVAAQVGVDLRVLRSWMELPYRILVGFGRGSGKRYPQTFLDRAMLVQRLRAENLPLAEVASRLRAVRDDELADLLTASQRTGRGRIKGSAAEYAEMMLSTRGINSNVIATSHSNHQSRRTAPVPVRSSWERIIITSELEIHTRRPMTRDQNRRLEDLLKEAERLFGAPPGTTT
jgi:DNA-binding transcriptional MerR regulator